MKRLSWKYIAGLIDGEGCIDFQICGDNRSNSAVRYPRPRLRVAMTEGALPVLEMMKTNFGGNVWCATKRHNPKWQDAYYWELQGRRIRGFLQNLQKHLILKKEQAKFCIWWIDNMMGKQKKMDGFENINEARKVARQELSAMKLSPQRLSDQAVQAVKSVLMR